MTVIGDDLSAARMLGRVDARDGTDELRDSVADVIAGCPIAAAAMDAAGRVTLWNRAAEALFGHDDTTAVGSPLADLVALPAQHAGGFAAWQELSGAPGRLADGVSVLTTHRDGTVLPVQLTVTTLSPGSGVAWFRPVNDVERPSTSDDLFRVIFERAPEAITILDPDLRQRTVNPAGLALVGLVPGMENVGRGAVYVHPDDMWILEDRARRRHEGEDVGPVRYRVSHADGSWRWLESLSVDLRDVAPISGYLVLSRDVTEAEDQRQALQAATERLDRRDRFRNRMLSAVSHELRTPLTAILSASEHLATDDVDAAELQAYAQLIHRNATRLEAMVADFLLIGRVQSSTLPVEVEAVDVASVVHNVAATYRSPSGPPVRVQATPGPHALADPMRLSQVVDNLVANALKFGDGTGVDITTSHRRGCWTVTVSDRGPGVDPDELEHVFEPYYRGSTTAGATEGSGLGLSIAKGVVELHGGDLDLRPREGGGTDAVVTLPDRSRETPRDC